MKRSVVAVRVYLDWKNGGYAVISVLTAPESKKKKTVTGMMSAISTVLCVHPVGFVPKPSGASLQIP